MMESLLFASPWVTMLVWALLYVIDYYLALIITRFSRAQEIFCFETDTGRASAVQSIQRDIRQLKGISPTMLCLLVIGAGVLWLASDTFPQYGFEVVAGAFVFNELRVFLQALRGILIYRRLLTSKPGVAGRITYTIEFQYWQRFVELAILAITLLLASIVMESLVLLGGGVGIALSSVRHYLASRRHRQPQPVTLEDKGKMGA